MGNADTEHKQELDQGDYLILGVILGILGTALYEMISGAILTFVPSYWTTWAKAIGAFIAVGILEYGRRRRRKKRASKSNPTAVNSATSPPSS